MPVGQFTGAMVSFIIGSESLQIPDGHRIVFFTYDTDRFTLDFLGAYPPTYCGKAVFGPQVSGSVCKSAFFDVPNESRDIHTHRAPGYT